MMNKITKSSLFLLLLVSCADAQAEQGGFLDRIKNFFGLSQKEVGQDKEKNRALEKPGSQTGEPAAPSTEISGGGHLDGYWRGGIAEGQGSFQDQPFIEEVSGGALGTPGQYPQSDLSITPEMIPGAETPPLPETSQQPIEPVAPPLASGEQRQPFAGEHSVEPSIMPDPGQQSDLSITPEMIPGAETQPLPEMSQQPIEPVTPPLMSGEPQQSFTNEHPATPYSGQADIYRDSEIMPGMGQIDGSDQRETLPVIPEETFELSNRDFGMVGAKPEGELPGSGELQQPSSTDPMFGRSPSLDSQMPE